MNLTYFTPFFIAWFITHFGPGQLLLDNVYKHLPKKIQSFRSHLSCFKCVTFWTTIILTLDPIHAMAMSMLAYTWERLMMSLKINF